MPISLSGSLNLSGSLTTTGTITATTLVVQTITSSISSVTGSTNFGSLADNTHTFTGSMFVSGSSAFSGSVTVNGDNSIYTGGTANNFNTYALGIANTKNLVFASTSASQAGGRNWSGGIGADASENIFLGSFNNLTFGAGSLATRMTISGSNGNVGIGTTSPAELLHLYKSTTVYQMIQTVSGGSGTVYRRSNSTTPDWTIGHGAASANENFEVYTAGTGAFTWTMNGLERMRITSGGGVYFGTTGGINGNINYEFRASNSNGGVAILSAYNTSTFASSPSISCYKGSTDTSSSNRFIQFYCNGESQPMGGIVGNGATNVQFASISDIREKENIVSIDGSLNKILALNPVEFDWLKTGEHIKAGFVAQQVEEVFPEYVVENMSNDGEEERKGLTGGMSSGIIAHLVKAIQELTARVQYLENK